MKGEKEASQEEADVVIARALVALLLASVILLGPFYRQVLGGREAWVPRWQMFSGKGLGYYSVHFETVGEGGKRRPVEWDEVSPSTTPERPPMRVVRINNSRQLQTIVAKYCHNEGPGTELYVHARKAVRTGWESFGDPKLNVCEPANRRQLRPKSERQRKRRRRRGR